MNKFKNVIKKISYFCLVGTATIITPFISFLSILLFAEYFNPVKLEWCDINGEKIKPGIIKYFIALCISPFIAIIFFTIAYSILCMLLSYWKLFLTVFIIGVIVCSSMFIFNKK